MNQLLRPPTFHKLPDERVLAGRRPHYLTVVHIGQRLDITHIKHHGNEAFVERMLLYLMPGDRRHKLSRKGTRLPLVPLENVFVGLKSHLDEGVLPLTL